MLDIRWLRDLIAIADTQSITRAAILRNVSQSGLSRRLQSLENWAGAPLFDRGRVPLVLTQAGVRMLNAARETVACLDGTRRLVRDERNCDTIRLAVSQTLSVQFLPDWLARIDHPHDRLRLSVVSDNIERCASLFGMGSVDLLIGVADAEGEILRRAPAAIGTCPFITIGHETLVPCSAPGPDGRPRHRVRAGSRRTPYLAYDAECCLGWPVQRLAASHPALNNLVVAYESSQADGLRTMARAGLGVAWLPLSAARGDLASGGLVQDGGHDLMIGLDIRLYHPSGDLSPAITTFLDRVRAAFGTALLRRSSPVI